MCIYLTQMKKYFDILKSHKYSIIWTLCYIAVMWCILYFMFNFDMFSALHWRYVHNIRLRGFGGFVFCLLILAAIPLYISTTALILRNKKPLITIPLPKIELKSKQTPETSDAPATEQTDETPKPDPLPDEMPLELKTVFLRARENLERAQQSSIARISHKITPANAIPTVTDDAQYIPQPDEFNEPIPVMAQTAPSPIPLPESTVESLSDFPLPTDFDIDISTPTFSAIPSFTEINFDEPTPPAAINTAPVLPSDINGPHHSFNNDDLKQHLTSINQPFEEVDDIIITNSHAIATHSDKDFWVTDNENWFATGKVRPSPIAAVCGIAHDQKLKPAIYLSATNIMDLDTLIPQWESIGVTVITDLSQIQ